MLHFAIEMPLGTRGDGFDGDVPCGRHAPRGLDAAARVQSFAARPHE